MMPLFFFMKAVLNEMFDYICLLSYWLFLMWDIIVLVGMWAHGWSALALYTYRILQQYLVVERTHCAVQHTLLRWNKEFDIWKYLQQGCSTPVYTLAWCSAVFALSVGLEEFSQSEPGIRVRDDWKSQESSGQLWSVPTTNRFKHALTLGYDLEKHRTTCYQFRLINNMEKFKLQRLDYPTLDIKILVSKLLILHKSVN